MTPRSSAIKGSSPIPFFNASKSAYPGPFTQLPFTAVFSAGRNLPVCFEAAEMVDPEDIIEGQIAFDPGNPPAVIVSCKDIPPVERIPPSLPGRAEIVGRNTGNDSWIAAASRLKICWLHQTSAESWATNIGASPIMRMPRSLAYRFTLPHCRENCHCRYFWKPISLPSFSEN